MQVEKPAKKGWGKMPQAVTRGEERRGHPRLRCVGIAELFTTPNAGARKARILDLSVIGCRLLLQEPVRLDVDSMVEVKFIVNQLPFRVIGQVKVQRTPSELGIVFPALSARVRLQVEDLVKELMEEEYKLLSVFGDRGIARSTRLA